MDIQENIEQQQHTCNLWVRQTGLHKRSKEYIKQFKSTLQEGDQVRFNLIVQDNIVATKLEDYKTAVIKSIQQIAEAYQMNFEEAKSYIYVYPAFYDGKTKKEYSDLLKQDNYVIVQGEYEQNILNTIQAFQINTQNIPKKEINEIFKLTLTNNQQAVFEELEKNILVLRRKQIKKLILYYKIVMTRK